MDRHGTRQVRKANDGCVAEHDGQTATVRSSVHLTPDVVHRLLSVLIYRQEYFDDPL
jgi:hypothetical protein